jgi:hypothetical protein
MKPGPAVLTVAAEWRACLADRKDRLSPECRAAAAS